MVSTNFERMDRTGSRSKSRACMGCAIILPGDKFKRDGCPNCPCLALDKSRNMEVATTTRYKGQIYYLNPAKSWIGKWQRNKQCVPGFYAMIVEGDLPYEFINAIEREGVEYVNRSHSFTL